MLLEQRCDEDRSRTGKVSSLLFNVRQVVVFGVDKDGWGGISVVSMRRSFLHRCLLFPRHLHEGLLIGRYGAFNGGLVLGYDRCANARTKGAQLVVHHQHLLKIFLISAPLIKHVPVRQLQCLMLAHVGLVWHECGRLLTQSRNS